MTEEKLPDVDKEGVEDKQEGVDVNNMVEQANAAADRLEAANKKTEELVLRAEEAKARDILGGGSDAGQKPVEKEEESNADYASKVLGGDVDEKKD